MTKDDIQGIERMLGHVRTGVGECTCDDGERGASYDRHPCPWCFTIRYEVERLERVVGRGADVRF